MKTSDWIVAARLLGTGAVCIGPRITGRMYCVEMRGRENCDWTEQWATQWHVGERGAHAALNFWQARQEAFRNGDDESTGLT